MASTQERLDQLKDVNDRLTKANANLADADLDQVRLALLEAIGAQIALTGWAADLEGALIRRGVIDTP